jgi:probable rRNA maturation factor
MAAARLHVNVACPDSPARATASAEQAAAVRGLAPWLTGIAPATARGDVCIALVSDARMKALNRQFRGKDKVTDVLSFPAEASPAREARERRFLGDIVIAAGVAKKQAKAAGHSLNTEIRVLALHGLLHLLGFDHDADGGKMARMEARLRKKAGLPEGLIERAAPSTRVRSRTRKGAPKAR